MNKLKTFQNKDQTEEIKKEIESMKKSLSDDYVSSPEEYLERFRLSYLLGHFYNINNNEETYVKLQL